MIQGFAVSVAVVATTSWANGNNSLGESLNVERFGGGIATAGAGLRVEIDDTVTQPVTLSLVDVPVGAVVSEAWLYVAELTSDPATGDGEYTFAGSPVTGTLIGTGPDSCWNLAANLVYRVDVTAVVPGNGAYTLADVGDAAVPTEGQGAALVVVYQQANTGARTRVVVNDGSVVIDSQQADWSTTLGNFTVSQAPISAFVHTASGDGQASGSPDLRLNGTVVLAGTSVGDGLLGGGWDVYRADVTTLVPPGTTSLEFGEDPDPVNDDCLLWPFVAVEITEPAGDADNDGLTDDREDQNGDFDIDNDDADGDGVPNYLDPDADGDGLPDGEEVDLYETDPWVADTDGDGLSDGDEVNLHLTSPLAFDTDGDGLSDGDEIDVHTTDPLDDDSDDDGLTDGAEVEDFDTDPLDADTDDDGVSDGDEVDSGSDPNTPPTPTGITGDTGFGGDTADTGAPVPTNPNPRGDGDGESSEGCGCNQPSAPVGVRLAMLGLVAFARRRRP